MPDVTAPVMATIAHWLKLAVNHEVPDPRSVTCYATTKGNNPARSEGLEPPTF